MREIICLNCRSKILREDVEFCHNCGGNSLGGQKGTYLECCKKRVPEYEFCRFCPYCGKKTGHVSPEQMARFRENERRLEEQQRRYQEESRKRLKGVKFETKSTRCEYQGSLEHMLSALYQDQARNELLVEDILREAENSNNGIVVLSASEKQLGDVQKLLTPKVRGLVFVRSSISDAGMRNIQAGAGPGTIWLILPAEFMELESRYINRLFLASIFVLDEHLIQRIAKLRNEALQPPLVIFDYCDQDKEGHFYKMHEERIKFYQREGATKLEDPKGERSTP